MANSKMEQLHSMKQEIYEGGGKAKIEKQHAKGKLTARERINLLFDEGSFIEIDAFIEHRSTNFGMDKIKAPGEGVVSGYGTVDGRLVFAYAQDFTVLGGSLGEMHAAKITKVQQMAIKMGAPIVGINDSGGARIQEYRNTVASPYIAAARGYIDDVIEPMTTRQRIISSFDMLSSKRESVPAKKHGNMPL